MVSGAIVVHGRRWSIQRIAVPSFSTGVLDFLAGVSCATHSACLAVGLEYPPIAADVNYDYLALVEGRHGALWSDQSPALSLTRDGFLLAVSCPKATRCIAVGQNVTSALAMGWDGSSWTVQLAPVAPPVMSVLNGVSCVSRADCVAVGAHQRLPLVERWDGTTWSVQSTA